MDIYQIPYITSLVLEYVAPGEWSSQVPVFLQVTEVNMHVYVETIGKLFLLWSESSLEDPTGCSSDLTPWAGSACLVFPSMGGTTVLYGSCSHVRMWFSTMLFTKLGPLGAGSTYHAEPWSTRIYWHPLVKELLRYCLNLYPVASITIQMSTIDADW